MKLGVLTNVVGNMPLEDALKYFKSMGIQMVEIGCGGYPGKDHCDPEVLLHDEAKYQEFCDTIKKYDMEVSAFSCHGNPIHPNKELAAAYDKDMRNAVLMAENTACIRSTASPAARAIARPLSIRTGLYAHGRTISVRSSSISGRFLSITGKIL